MRRLAIGVAIASLALVSACGSDDPEPTDTSDDTESSAPAEEEPSEAAEETSEPAEGGEATALMAVVGTEDDPDAFVITLTDESGETVTELPAGDYTIEVTDPSAIHNFHLTGGGVDESTTVDEIVDTTWEVTFEPGDYSYVCDPHPNMSGAFTVT